MFEKFQKYVKRARFFNDLKTCFNKSFISSTRVVSAGGVSRKLILQKSFAVVKGVLAVLWACCKMALFVPKSAVEGDGVSEYYIYRQYAKYRMTVFLTLVVILFVYGTQSVFFSVGNIISPSDYIVRISINGEINSEKYGYGGTKFYEEVIKKVAEDKSAKAVIVSINSGGGSVFASEALYEGLKKIASTKPTFCEFGSTAASGAYMAALACKSIYARQTTLVGSIGVRRDMLDVVDLANKIGIKLEVMTSGKLKAAGHPGRHLSEEERKYFQDLMNKIHHFFVNLVAEARGISVEKVYAFADGRVVMGKEAKELGLIDKIGGPDDLLSDIKSEFSLDKNIQVVDVGLPDPDELYARKVRRFAGLMSAGAVDGINNLVPDSIGIRY